MGNYRILRMYHSILYISLVLSGLYWVGGILTSGFRNFPLMIVTIIIAVISIVSLIALIQLITLALKLDEESFNTKNELSQAKNSLREIKTELEALKNSVAWLESRISKPAAPVAPSEPAPVGVQVRARVRSDDILLSSPGGVTAVSINGSPLKVLASQGVYLTARSADAQWYKFSPDRVSSGWLAADALQIGDIEMVDQLPVER